MQPEHRFEPQCGGYNPGHPWYYVLGGPVLPPRLIMAAVKLRGYRGYLAADMDRAGSLPEPKRSQALRRMKANALADYRADLTSYRDMARKLHAYRREVHGDAVRCEGIHQGISLKHNHLFNDFAHLIELDRLLTVQRDLFDF